eukprot:353695-Chlamydomonas_euryale.AAC.4
MPAFLRGTLPRTSLPQSSLPRLPHSFLPQRPRHSDTDNARTCLAATPHHAAAPRRRGSCGCRGAGRRRQWRLRRLEPACSPAGRSRGAPRGRLGRGLEDRSEMPMDAGAACWRRGRWETAAPALGERASLISRPCHGANDLSAPALPTHPIRCSGGKAGGRVPTFGQFYAMSVTAAAVVGRAGLKLCHD